MTLRVNTAVRHQRMEGFGASGSWSADPIGEHWSPDGRERLARLLFSVDEGIGLSVWKFNAGATRGRGEETQFASPYAWRKAESFRPDPGPYDWAAHAGQQWFLGAARDHGVKRIQVLFYSPPGWMTKNGLTHPDADSGTTNLDPAHLGEYAAYVARVVEYLERAHAVQIADVVPLNEPNWAWGDSIQEANRYAVEDIKAVVTAVAAELSPRALWARIVIPEAGEIMALLDDATFSRYWLGLKRRYNAQNLELTTGGKFREYAAEFLADPEIRRLTGGTISAHSYWSDTTGGGDDRLVRLRELVRADLDRHAPGAVYLQTEYCILGDRGPGRDLTMASAIGVAEVIHRDLTILDAAEWSWWLAISPHDYKDGLLYTDWERPGDPETIHASRIYHVLGQYSRFIRPGAVRVDAALAEESRTLLPSAWIGPDGEGVTLVIVNTADHAESLRVEWPAPLVIHRTDAANALSRIGTLEPGTPLELPPASVTTLVGAPAGR